MADYQIIPISREQAEVIVFWTYEPPYSVYDLKPEDLTGLLNPDYRYHHMLDVRGELVGYCCFGLDAQVPGGDYSRAEPEVLDVGVGMRPDMTGKGRGADFVAAILDYARENYRPSLFRVTVADFNGRSLRTFRKLGFLDTHNFIREAGQMPFTQLERTAYG